MEKPTPPKAQTFEELAESLKAYFNEDDPQPKRSFMRFQSETFKFVRTERVNKAFFEALE